MGREAAHDADQVCRQVRDLPRVPLPARALLDAVENLAVGVAHEMASLLDRPRPLACEVEEAAVHGGPALRIPQDAGSLGTYLGVEGRLHGIKIFAEAAQVDVFG